MRGKLKLRWLRLLVRTDQWLQRALAGVALPGFRRAPLYAILRLLWLDISNRAFVLNSSAMAYAFFLSIFPTLIFAFSLLPYLPFRNLDSSLQAALAELLPGPAYEVIDDTFARTLQQGSISRLLFSLAFVLFLGIRGVTVMANAFNSLDPLHQKDRGLVKGTLLGLYLYLILLFMGLVGVAVWVEGQQLISRLSNAPGWLGLLQYWGVVLASRLAIVFVLLFTLNFIYRIAPTFPYRWRTFSPGSVVAALLLLGAILLLDVYFRDFSNYNKIYGSLGAVIVLLVWFYWLSFVLQIGFHLNSNIEELAGEQQQLRMQRAQLVMRPPEDPNAHAQGSWYALQRRGRQRK
ncbi:MAG: YihY/virulence factor BrkB family protein [Bacteroidetes bacterium]|jgi:membrane protein|nr:YihY/virulence factor BrkB family protein [Bacteroidota bacterium]